MQDNRELPEGARQSKQRVNSPWSSRLKIVYCVGSDGNPTVEREGHVSVCEGMVYP